MTPCAEPDRDVAPDEAPEPEGADADRAERWAEYHRARRHAEAEDNRYVNAVEKRRKAAKAARKARRKQRHGGRK
jgi:hypothetical protein